MTNFAMSLFLGAVMILIVIPACVAGFFAMGPLSGIIFLVALIWGLIGLFTKKS